MTNSPKRKSHWTTAVLAAAALAVSAGIAAPALGAARTPAHELHKTSLRPLDREGLRAALAPLPDRNVRGGLIRITGRDGRWSRIAGPSVPSPDAHFRIMSITKIFTSTVVLQLAAEGKLELDDTAQALVPGLLPKRYGPITVAQLLSHTSGLPEAKCAEENVPPREVVESALACGNPTRPGRKVDYNGINYFIAGLIIEAVTGHPYADEVRARLLSPLGLDDTSVPQFDDWSMPAPYTKARVIQRGSEGLKDVSAQSPYAWAEGGMISNASDLKRFFTALFRGRLLPPAQQRELFTLPHAAGERRYSRGGLERTELPGGTVVWGKSGGYLGYTSGVFATRDRRRMLVYSLNPTGRSPELPYVVRIAEAAFPG